jgi:hypothetical protein
MTPAPDRPETIEVRISETSVCPRCAIPVLLSARYPHAWSNRAGEQVNGHKETALCGSCDMSDPAARPLLAALLCADGRPVAPRLDEAFAGLVLDWLAIVRDRTPNRADLDAEEARWRAGDL